MISDLLNYITDNFSSEQYEYREDLFSVYLNCCLDEKSWDFVEKSLDSIKSISGRDEFSLTIDINGISKAISNTVDTDISTIYDHLKWFEDDDIEWLKLTIDIQKRLSLDVISIYSMKGIAIHLLSLQFSEILASFAFLLSEGKVILEIFEDAHDFGSKTIIFRSHTSTKLTPGIIPVRGEILNSIRDNVYAHGHKIELIPNDFRLLVQSNNHSLNELFDNVCSALSIAYISNSFEIADRNKVSFKIKGYRSVVSEEKRYDELGADASIAFAIFSWIYNEGNVSDKLGLTRNVLSLSLNAKSEILFNKDSWDAIKSNFNIYLEKNVTSYMEVKNKITEFVLESTTKVYGLCDSFLDSFKNSIITFITFFLTVVLVSGLKDNGAKAIFSPIFLWVVIFLSTMSAVWLCLVFIDTKNRFEHSCNSIRDTLKKNYHNILVEGEVDRVTDPIFYKNRTYLHSQLRRYSITWAVLIIFFVLIFGVGVIVFRQADTAQTKAMKIGNLFSDHDNLHQTSSYPTISNDK